MTIPDLLLRLLIAVLVFIVGEKVIGLVKDASLKEILNIILIVAVVLYVIFGAIFPIR